MSEPVVESTPSVEETKPTEVPSEAPVAASEAPAAAAAAPAASSEAPAAAASTEAPAEADETHTPVVANDFYSLSALTSKKKDFHFSELKGKVVLVVNVASKCGFTPQYAGLEKLYQAHKDQDFVILGFPCNQFGSQEPGDEATIESFCQVNFGVTFPLFAKVEVNGDKESPVFAYLKNHKKQLGMKRIKWNFEKFLINKKGQVVERYSSIASPESIEKKVVELLAESA